MRPVVLVPNLRRDILWMNTKRAMNYTTWNDVVGHWANPPLNSASDAPTAGVYANLGGIFTSPPVAVTLGEDRLDVFGLGTDYAVFHKTLNAGVWTPNWERLGGNFMSTPFVVSTGTTRIDLFGLGIDQGMVHMSYNGSAWSAFDELGGCFSGTPIVLPTADGKFDIFARAIDYKLYHLLYDPAIQSDWKILGGGLLGEPVAASAPAAVRVGSRIFLYVVGDDGAMWSIVFDGKIWKPWSSLGVAQKSSFPASVPDTTFAAEPAVLWTPASSIVIHNPTNTEATLNAAPPVSPARQGIAGIATSVLQAINIHPVPTPAPAADPFTGRIDVFATGTDGALWHNWMDISGWQKAWENLAGNLDCAPAVIRPESNVVIAQTRPLGFNVLEPGADSVVRLRSFDGATWTTPWPVGPIFTNPNAFSIGVSQVDIASLRSNGSLGESDTDNGTANLSVGRWPIATAYLDMGDVGTGAHPQSFGMSLNRVSVELAEPFVYMYVILNQGHKDSAIVDAISTVIAKAAEDYLNDTVKSLINPSSNSAFLGALGIDVVEDAGGGPIFVGSLVGAAVAAGLDAALSALLANCDGVVATGSVNYLNGRALQQQTMASANRQVSGKIHSPGTDSPSGCGSNSDYTVTYLILDS